MTARFESRVPLATGRDARAPKRVGRPRDAEPLRDIQSIGNVIVDVPANRVERAEGLYDPASVVFDDTTDRTLLPGAIPTLDAVRLQDTSILRTRDVSFVATASRKGLYRIHLREAGAGGVEERFEYVVSGTASAISTWLDASRAQGVYVSESRSTGTAPYALVLSPSPLEVPATLAAVTFDALRAGDRDGTLSWLCNASNWASTDANRQPRACRITRTGRASCESTTSATGRAEPLPGACKIHHCSARSKVQGSVTRTA